MPFVNVEIKKRPYNDTEHRFHMQLYASLQAPRNPDTNELYTMANLPISKESMQCELCSSHGTDDVALLKQLFLMGAEYMDRSRGILDGTVEPNGPDLVFTVDKNQTEK